MTHLYADPNPWLTNNDSVLVPKTAQELWSYIGDLSFGMSPGTKFVWRGLPDYTYAVESSLLRDLRLSGTEIKESTVRHHEQALVREARNWGLGGNAYGHATDLHILAMLQHHGVHTRLIDVTYNPMTALWFACAVLPERPGTLVSMIATDPRVYETSMGITSSGGSLGDPYSYDYEEALTTSEREADVFLVIPKAPDPRMTAQEGLFISAAVPAEGSSPALIGLPKPKMDGFFNKVAQFMHAGLPAKLSEPWGPFAASGIIISPDVKAQTLNVLEQSFNRTHKSLFPDLSGFVQQYHQKIFRDGDWSTIDITNHRTD